MIEVEMSRDIREYEPHVLWMFTLRQVICILLGLSYGGPFLYFANMIGFSTRIMIAALIMAPVVACGWVKLYGMPLEKFAVQCFRVLFVYPSRRPYEANNNYHRLIQRNNMQKKIKIKKSASHKQMQ